MELHIHLRPGLLEQENMVLTSKLVQVALMVRAVSSDDEQDV